MTKSEFYNAALLAVIPPVTQAYILKHNLPFAKNADDARERLEQRTDELEAIAEMADFLAVKMTAYWKDSDDFYRAEIEAE
jgi:hypothetical protein